MLVICINDKNKPSDIPQSAWIKLDKIYTCIGVTYDNFQNTHCAMLEEVQPPPPYTGYKAARFLPLGDPDISELLNNKKVENVV